MDSYVNSLGNFAAGVGVEALAGAAVANRGQARPGGVGRGRAGAWHTGYAHEAAPSLHVELPLHLVHLRPAMAEAWKYERRSQRHGVALRLPPTLAPLFLDLFFYWVPSPATQGAL